MREIEMQDRSLTWLRLRKSRIVFTFKAYPVPSEDQICVVELGARWRGDIQFQSDRYFSAGKSRARQSDRENLKSLRDLADGRNVDLGR